MKKRSGIFIKSVLQGRLLLRLKMDKYIRQIVFFFICASGYIGASLYIESVLHEKEENDQTLSRLKSVKIEKTCELTSLYSVCHVVDMLSEMGSKVELPGAKAKTIE